MAKRRNGPNKSQAVRDMLNDNPGMSVKDIVGTMASKGMKITPNLVYFLKGKIKEKKQRKGRVMKAARAASGGGTIVENGFAGKADAVTLIREIKAWALKTGGIGKLKALVEALAE
jgi:hypothetical protein